MINAFVPTWLSQYTVMTFASRTGTFSATSSPGANSSFAFVPVYSATSVALTYARYGDANLNGNVNAADFTALATHFNQSGQTWQTGDFNNDGKVNGLDFNLLASNFGKTATSSEPLDFGERSPSVSLRAEGSRTGSLVPEPAGLLMTAMALMACGRKRRR